MRGEPLSYETGFSVKWLIEDQIQGDPQLNYDPARGPVLSPLLLWGPYIWADGTIPRLDGLVWLPDDFELDNVHPSPSGEQKAADLLSAFFDADDTADEWYDSDPTLELIALDATDDATVDAAQPNTALGLATSLNAAGGAQPERAYLKFDVSAVQEVILHAKLSLETINEGDAEVRNVADSSWDEATITFATAPPLGEVLQTMPIWSRQSAVSADLTAQATSDGVAGPFSVALTSVDSETSQLESKEAGQPPRLILSVASQNIYVRADKVLADDAVRLSWNDTGAPSYRIRRADGSRPEDFMLSTVFFTSETTFLDTGTLHDGGDYYYLIDEAVP